MTRLLLFLLVIFDLFDLSIKNNLKIPKIPLINNSVLFFVTALLQKGVFYLFL